MHSKFGFNNVSYQRSSAVSLETNPFLMHTLIHVHAAASLLVVILLSRTVRPVLSYFFRIVNLWNTMCNVAYPSSFISLGYLNHFLKNTYVSFNVIF